MKEKSHDLGEESQLVNRGGESEWMKDQGLFIVHIQNEGEESRCKWEADVGNDRLGNVRVGNARQLNADIMFMEEIEKVY